MMVSTGALGRSAASSTSPRVRIGALARRATLLASTIAAMLAALVVGACEGWIQVARAPLVPANAGFAIADAVWFEDEHTLFVFWRFEADQGLGPTSRIEVGFQTANALQAPQAVDAYVPVHRHVDVDCGTRGRCGSLSIALREEPLSVPIQLRWHEDSELAFTRNAALTIMRAGDPWKQRSAVVYGVFDADNALVQWRLRHQFPNLGNHDVEALGLRRQFRIHGPRVGDLDDAARAGFVDNPWGYALLASCPTAFVAHDESEFATDERAVFSSRAVDPLLVTRQVVCAEADVIDADGTFTATALARRNPDAVPAFPFLRTPVAEPRRMQFDLVTCANIVSPAHLAMQQQRLLHDTETICVDDVDEPGRQGELAARINAAIDEERVEGDDLVLTVVLNRRDADEAVAVAVEAVLQGVLTEERTKTSPRAVGAVVYDSASFDQRISEAKPYLLWCPAALGIDDLAELVDPLVLNQLYHCAIAIDLAVPIDLPQPLDQLTVAQLPVLATRRQFESYVAQFGEGAVGPTTKITVLAPRRGADARDVILDSPGDDPDAILDPFSPFSSTDIATFFDDEYLTLLPEESLSVCPGDASGYVVAQAGADEAPLPLDALPARHADDPRGRYQLGLRWDGAFYLRFDYRAVLATATEVIGLTVPFSPSLPGDLVFREELWTRATFDLRKELLKCRRFCDHPTFDSAGIYQVQAPFAPTYANDCYAPQFPTPDDGGFPDDP